MNKIRAIVWITFLEGVRTRFFYGLFVVALLLFSSIYTLSYLFPRDVLKVAVDLSLGTISLVGLVLTLFMTTHLISKDLDKRTIHMVLVRPVSREQYILGKFLGLAALILTGALLLGGMGLLSVWAVDLATPDPYGVVHPFLFLLSVLMLALMLVLLVAVVFFFSSFSTSVFLALGLTLVSYLVGQSIEELKRFLESGAEHVLIPPALVWLVRIIYYVFPNLSAFDFKTHAAHGLAVPFSTVFWTAWYGVFYIGLMLTFAVLAFRRREFL